MKPTKALFMLCALRIVLGLSTATLLASGTESPKSSGRPLLVVGYAVTNVLRFHPVNGGGIEWRSAPVWRSLRGWVSYNTDVHGAYFAGIGAYYGIPIWQPWEIGLSFGPGYFRADHRLDLGAKIEFRSSIECSYRLHSGKRIGLGFGHISNGSIGRVNPGSEFVHLTLQIPL